MPTVFILREKPISVSDDRPDFMQSADSMRIDLGLNDLDECIGIDGLDVFVRKEGDEFTITDSRGKWLHAPLLSSEYVSMETMDWDQDGDTDLVLTHRSGERYLLANQKVQIDNLTKRARDRQTSIDSRLAAYRVLARVAPYARDDSFNSDIIRDLEDIIYRDESCHNVYDRTSSTGRLEYIVRKIDCNASHKVEAARILASFNQSSGNNAWLYLFEQSSSPTLGFADASTRYDLCLELLRFNPTDDVYDELEKLASCGDRRIGAEAYETLAGSNLSNWSERILRIYDRLLAHAAEDPRAYTGGFERIWKDLKEILPADAIIRAEKQLRHGVFSLEDFIWVAERDLERAKELFTKISWQQSTLKRGAEDVLSILDAGRRISPDDLETIGLPPRVDVDRWLPPLQVPKEVLPPEIELSEKPDDFQGSDQRVRAGIQQIKRAGERANLRGLEQLTKPEQILSLFWLVRYPLSHEVWREAVTRLQTENVGLLTKALRGYVECVNAKAHSLPWAVQNERYPRERNIEALLKLAEIDPSLSEVHSYVWPRYGASETGRFRLNQYGMGMDPKVFWERLAQTRPDLLDNAVSAIVSRFETKCADEDNCKSFLVWDDCRDYLATLPSSYQLKGLRQLLMSQHSNLSCHDLLWYAEKVPDVLGAVELVKDYLGFVRQAFSLKTSGDDLRCYNPSRCRHSMVWLADKDPAFVQSELDKGGPLYAFDLKRDGEHAALFFLAELVRANREFFGNEFVFRYDETLRQESERYGKAVKRFEEGQEDENERRWGYRDGPLLASRWPYVLASTLDELALVDREVAMRQTETLVTTFGYPWRTFKDCEGGAYVAFEELLSFLREDGSPQADALLWHLTSSENVLDPRLQRMAREGLRLSNQDDVWAAHLAERWPVGDEWRLLSLFEKGLQVLWDPEG